MSGICQARPRPCQIERGARGSLMSIPGPGWAGNEAVAAHPCCTAVRVLHSPHRGQFGVPPASILGEYTSADAENGQGMLTCTGCGDVNVTLRQVSEEWMGGLRWSFVTGGQQYVAFGTMASACVEDVHTWKFWQVNRYHEGNFRVVCTPPIVPEDEECCPQLNVIHSPQRGTFGSPSATILGRYTWSRGGYDCDDCDASVSLEPVSENWMGGTRWTFKTHGRQYPVYAMSDSSCPASVPSWKFWHSATSSYHDGSIFLQCGQSAMICCNR